MENPDDDPVPVSLYPSSWPAVGITDISRLPRVIRHQGAHHIRESFDFILRLLLRFGRRRRRVRTRVRIQTGSRLMRSRGLLAGTRDDIDSIRTPRQSWLIRNGSIRKTFLQRPQVRFSSIVLVQEPRQPQQRLHPSQPILETLNILGTIEVSASPYGTKSSTYPLGGFRFFSTGVKTQSVL